MPDIFGKFAKTRHHWIDLIIHNPNKKANLKANQKKSFWHPCFCSLGLWQLSMVTLVSVSIKAGHARGLLLAKERHPRVRKKGPQSSKSWVANYF